LAQMYEKTGRGDFVKRMASHGISAKKLAENPSKWVVMTRKSLLRDFEKCGVEPNVSDAWSWSQWRGYLAEGDGALVQNWFESRDCPACHIHTSGHAAPADLRSFARCIQPKVFIAMNWLRVFYRSCTAMLLRKSNISAWPTMPMVSMSLSKKSNEPSMF
jgi:ribonuclease J